jgi:hypothetical protein
MQLWESSAHVMSVEVLVQIGPLVTHAGTSSHVHACVPGVPPHVWCVPQVWLALTLRHPFTSAVHVTSVEAFSQTVPLVVHAGALLHEHEAEPGFPMHVSFVAHVAVPVTVRQPLASAVQVATVVVFSQTGPAAVHVALLLHVHWDEPAVPVQSWCGPQGVAAPYA